jgi:hypothetical protein
MGYVTPLFNCLHHQIEHSGAGAVGAVVRESDIRAWGASAGLPSCTVYDTDAAAPRLFSEAAGQTLNVGGMGMLMICAASRLQGMQQFDTAYGPARPEMEIAALSAAAHSIRQAGLIVAGCRRESGEMSATHQSPTPSPDVDA